MIEGDRPAKIAVIAGMPRAATTFLYHTLSRHPGAFVPARKELEYYSMNFGRGPDWYARFFGDCPRENVGFDISPMYFFAPEAAGRIAARTAALAAPTVIILRRPSEFALSFYKLRLRADPACPTFEEYLAGYDYTKDSSTLRLSFEPSFVQDAVTRFRSALGKSLLLIDYREFERDVLGVLHTVERFCGLSSHFTSANVDPTRVNGSDQQGSPMLNYLSHKKWFADLVTRVVPKQLILAVRLRAQTASQGSPVLRQDTEAEYSAQLEGRFEDGDRYIGALFANGPYVLGTGEHLVCS